MSENEVQLKRLKHNYYILTCVLLMFLVQNLRAVYVQCYCIAVSLFKTCTATNDAAYRKTEN